MEGDVMKRDVNALDQLLERRIKEHGYTGVAVCIRGPEGVMYERGFGLRSVEHQKPVDGNTVFGIASMSKSFTTLACCILHTEGKLNLDDPICKYFPNLHIPGIPDECLTLKSIGMNRSGIPPMEPLEWSIAMNSVERDTKLHREMVNSAPNKMETIDQIVDYLSLGKYGNLGAPGEYMSYLNEGFALLSYVVDQAAGITLEEFLMERIFKPLGMTRSILDLDCSEARALAGDDNITSLFEKDEDGKLVWDDDWSVLPPFRGCACIKSTALDVTKYYQMLSNWGVYEGVQIVPREAVELLIGREYPLKRKPFYCQALRKSLVAGKMICEHAGALHGVSTQGGFVEGGYSVAVLCNDSEVDMQDLQWICYNYILGQPLETDLNWAVPSGKKFSAPEMLTGHYIIHEGIPGHCIVSVEDGEIICVENGEKLLLKHCEKTVFAVFKASKPEERIATYRFFVKDGKAWGLKTGSRICQRLEETQL
ncbi:MAG: serine hydrolase [Firmicutes bacterium]|nr:serine hydrolase [Bacillota bacterium]